MLSLCVCHKSELYKNDSVGYANNATQCPRDSRFLVPKIGEIRTGSAVMGVIRIRGGGGGLKSAALDRNLTISFKQYKINHLFHLSFSALAMMMKLPHLSSASLVASNDVKLTPMLSIHFCCRLPLALDQ